MDLLSQQPLFSTEPETKGFDLSSGHKWIYPENYPIREYQFTIVKTSLFHNTLVCLPTGLGKTLIAAVVMYNFWRWYPSGLIVFLAPTKPLVAQQIDACHNIMGIPISETIELTGATHQKQREIAWRNKRVIFATPQTFQKDLEKGIVKTELIKCVVIDEAHRALGKHAYCESIRLLHQTNRYHRVLALSATPGGKLDAVQDVIRNLHITHLELRDDTSSDIIPYINERKLEIVQVGMGEDLTRFHERYIEIMDPHFRVLLRNNVIRGATSNITKGRIFHIRKEFMGRPTKPYNYGTIVNTLTTLMSMCHANELLINHGVRAFVHFLQNHLDKSWLKNEPNLLTLLDEMKEFVGPFPEMKSLMNGDATNIPDNIVFGHEKFNKLREILTAHFENAVTKNIDTRAIVFIEYRDIVNEVFILLLQLRPLIRPQVFVGQAGLKQKQQKKALDDFRNNHVNVLISTSVGEEGLDVGEVDLIICFDILQHSPTRLVQRMGRTGRRRDGHIIVLVADGREHKTLKSALARRDSLNNKVLHSSGIIDALGEASPRMIPENMNPECLKMRITAIPTTPRSKKQRRQVTSKAKKNYVNNDEKKVVKKMKPTSSDKTNSSKKMQSAMLRFLAAGPKQDNITQDGDVVDMRIQEVHPLQLQMQSIKNNSARIKSSDVKLLTSDNESVEFLTLWTMKQSENDMKTKENSLKISYMPELSFDNSDPFLNFEIPSLSILDCIKSLAEYIPPISDEFAGVHEVDDIETWEPDHFSYFMENPPCPELVLTKGRFEDLLDDTTDSDQTNISGNESFTDQQVDWGNDDKRDENNFQQKNCDSINETSLSNSIVIGGAFEDLLDESSDESVIEIQRKTPEPRRQGNNNNNNFTNKSLLNSQKTEEISTISLISSESEHFNDDENNLNENNLSQHSIKNLVYKQEKTVEKNDINAVEVDSNVDIDLGSDFGSWDNCLNKNSSNYTKMPSSNLVMSFHKKPIQSVACDVTTSGEKLQSIQETDNGTIDGNTSKGCISPDLSKSSQRRVRTKFNVSPNTVGQQSTIVKSASEIINLENSSDDDMFGVDSLLVDSDFEDQLTVVENSNNVNVNKIDNKSNVYVNPSVVQDELKTVESGEKTMNGMNSQSVKEKSASNNDCMDDLEWSSDFEISSGPIIESKYFKSTSKTTPHNSFRVQSRDVSENFNKVCTKTSENENEILKLKSISNKQSINIRDKFFSKIKSNSRQDIDSDDDFAPAKIEKRVYRMLESSFSDEEVFGNNPSRLGAGNWLGHLSNGDGPQSLSTKDLNKFVMPKPKDSSTKTLLRTEATRSTSLDSYPKKKQVARRRDRVKSAFIDDEAQVSTDTAYSVSSSEDDDENDDELADFVSHSQYHDTAVDMRAHYLQSVRSPRQPGRFLIKRPKTPPPDIQIYSQAIPDEPNTYLYDSFCVQGESETEYSDHSPEDISILTQVERKLKKKKRKRKNSSGSSQAKRKRIVTNMSDDTSEDETEKMRAEIADLSMMLKN